MNSDKIFDKLIIKNLGPISSLEIDIQSRITVFIGENGTGKSTIINSIAKAFTMGYEANLKTDANFWQIIILNNNDILFNCKVGQYTDNEPVNKLYSLLCIPISANRKTIIKSVNGPQIEGSVSSQGLTAILNRAYLKENDQGNLYEWILNRFFFSHIKEWESVKKYQNELDFFSQSLSTLVPNFPIEFDTVTEDMKVYFISPTGQLQLNQLSSGTQSILFILFQIIYALNNSYPESQNIFLEQAVILIDELDNHLHPEWQKNIINGLKNMFPNCQFIITTHSPIIISSCEENEVINLYLEDEDIKAKYIESPKGWLAEDIYRDIMGLSSSRNTEIENKINELEKLVMKQIEENGLNDEDRNKQEELISELSNLPESDPIVTLTKLNALNKSIIKNKI